MLILILVLLFVFWLFGYGITNILPVSLFRFNGHIVTLWDLLIFVIVVWLITSLRSPFGEIASILIILWVLSIFGIIAVAGVANLLVIAIIVGLLLYILRI